MMFTILECLLINQILYPLQFGARDQDCIMTKQVGDLEWIQICTMNKEQQVNDGRLDADHMRLDYRNFMDDEEVTLLPHKRDTDVADNPVLDIRDGPDTSDTQRDDWLLKMESLHGARPRWNEGERPPVINDRSGVLDLEAAGSVGGRKMNQHGIPALCCYSSGRYYWRRR